MKSQNHKRLANLFGLLLVLTVTEDVSGFPNGASDPTSCGDLSPSGGHGPSTATGAAPFTIELSAKTYSPGDVIQVTLRGVGGAQFKGFMVAGRRSDGSSDDNIGTFNVDTNGISKLICSQTLGNAITHNAGSAKGSITFDWTAPNAPQGDVVLHYTVVRSQQSDYFVGLTSDTITGPPPTFTQANSFDRDPACGVSKGCYSDCVGGKCDWEITWQESTNDYTISLKTTYDGTDDKYVALGLSSTGGMAQASVLSCVTHGGNVKVAGSFNPGYSNTPWTNPSDGIGNVVASYADGLLSCTFTKTKTSTDPQIYSLLDPWYLITARGSTTTSGNLLQHDAQSRFATNIKIDLSATTTDETFVTKQTTVTRPTGTTPPQGSTFPKDTRCGKTRGCYSDCGDDGCSLLLSWSPSASNSSVFEFTIEGAYSSTDDHYIAMGFSTRDKMDPASVLGCTYVSGVVDVYASFNPGYYNLQLSDPKEGISNVQGTMANGVMKCTFNRIKSSSTNAAQIFDLGTPWHLIVALGPAAAGGVLLEHNSVDMYVTSSQVDFTDMTLDIGLSKIDYPKVKWHACLMIIGWMLSSSIGLAFAKFYKKQWPDRTLCGVKVWFAVHRFCMVLLFILACISILLIFLEIDGYSEIHGEDYKKAHPILGLVTTGLMVINPFMSLLRCGPDHPQRWVFNWSHWAVGTSAHILSGVTITLGMYLPKSQMDKDHGLVIMITYGVWHVIFLVILSIIDYISQHEERRVFSLDNGTELKPVTSAPHNAPPNHLDHPDPQQLDNGKFKINSSTSLVDEKKSNEPPVSGAKKVMLLFHTFVLTFLSIYLIVLVIDGE